MNKGICSTFMPQCSMEFSWRMSFLPLHLAQDQNGEKPMGLTKSLNVVMFCAAFAFISAMILGVM
jgi:hypothetical protein